MAATAAARGLSRTDLDGIRSTLAGGRKPKVVFTEAAGQIAGQTGQVVELMDPPVDEWVVVRFGRDELPFSPVDLAIPATGAGQATGTESGRAGRGAGTGAEHGDSLRAGPPRPTAAPGGRHHARDIHHRFHCGADPRPPRSRRPARPHPRTPKVKPPAALTVTISYTDGEWMVGAQQGTKALAKPYTIKASEALRMVALLDVPGVHEAVEQIVEAERAETQAHAERLRAELAEIEAHLADLPSAKR